MALARLLVLFLLAVLGGWVLRRPFSSPAPDPSALPSAKSKTERDPKQQQLKAQAALLHREGYGNYSSHRAELRTWTQAAIRSALEDGIRDPGMVLPESPETKAVLALLGEWTSRDPQAAKAWWLDLKPENLRAQLGGALAEGWPADRAEEELELVLNHHGSSQSRPAFHYSALLRKACEAAAARGPEALEALLARIRENGLIEPQEALSLPRDFDFAAWVRTPEMAKRLEQENNPLTESFVFGTWMEHDPEAAMDFIIADNRKRGRNLASGLLSAMDRYQADPAVVLERARRVAAHSGSLPVEEQREIIQRAGEQLAHWPEILKTYAAAIPDPSVRAEAYLNVARSQMERDIPLALELLSQASGSTDSRIRMLEYLIAARPRGSSDLIYRKVETQVRGTLAGWQVPAERIDSLVAAMKKIP